MSLRDLVNRKTRIEHGEHGFEVRGLSLEDVVLLMENHKEALVEIFVAKDGTDFELLLQKFPNFISAAIAYAADEHDLEEMVRKLPIGIQLRAIQEVWELSSLDVETVGKLANSVLRGVTKFNAEDLTTLQESLKSGAAPSLPAAST